jgi:hypothetical protein
MDMSKALFLVLPRRRQMIQEHGGVSLKFISGEELPMKWYVNADECLVLSCNLELCIDITIL